MYKISPDDQLSEEEFFLPFDGRLSRNNRWVKLAQIIPWDRIEEEYAAHGNMEEGRPALSSRIAFGALFIKEYMNFTDAETAQGVQENAYMQYFLGLHACVSSDLFHYGNYLSGDLIQGHIFVEGNVCGSTAAELHTVI